MPRRTGPGGPQRPAGRLERVSGRTKLIVALAVVALFAAAAVLLPIPGPADLRAWAAATGPATPLVLFVAYSLLTVAPIPRTVFNLAAGLLVGTAAGITIGLVATTIAAGLSFGLARLLGRDLVTRHLHRSAVRTVNDRLSDGGVLAITSLRLSRSCRSRPSATSAVCPRCGRSPTWPVRCSEACPAPSPWSSSATP